MVPDRFDTDALALGGAASLAAQEERTMVPTTAMTAAAPKRVNFTDVPFRKDSVQEVIAGEPVRAQVETLATAINDP